MSIVKPIEKGETTQESSSTNGDVAALRDRALESITLAIELFNRPNECARHHTVIILLHHCFELFLKSAIVAKRGSAFDEERGFSFGFDRCLAITCEEKLINRDHAKFLSILDNTRDGAIHYYQIISERLLYIFTQASISLFNVLLKSETGKGLLDFLPQRVVALSANPPQSISKVLDDDFQNLRDLLQREDFSKRDAIAMLRPLMAFKIGGEQQHRRMTNAELEVATENLSAADTWRVVFPEIAKLEFDAAGDDIIIGFKVVKDSAEAMAVTILKPGEEHLAKGTIVHKEVNLFDKFNLNLYKLAEHLGVTAPKASAMIREFKITDDSEMFRCIPIGSQTHKRYSKKALDILRTKVQHADECWQKHRQHFSGRRAKKS